MSKPEHYRKHKRPDLVKKCIGLRLAGASYLAIEAETSVSRSTLQRLFRKYLVNPNIASKKIVNTNYLRQI